MVMKKAGETKEDKHQLWASARKRRFATTNFRGGELVHNKKGGSTE